MKVIHSVYLEQNNASPFRDLEPVQNYIEKYTKVILSRFMKAMERIQQQSSVLEVIGLEISTHLLRPETEPSSRTHKSPKIEATMLAFWPLKSLPRFATFAGDPFVK